jgi:Flp pilus assembly protein TadG
MRTTKVSFVQRVLNDQHGQALVLVAVGMLALMGMAGLTIDLSHAYVVRGQLQNSANAAVLAAAGAVYNTGAADSATSIATSYAALNPVPGVTVTVTPSTLCLNLLMPGKTGCGVSGAVDNAIRVKETAAMPTYFMRLFGVSTLNVGATATASMQGIAQLWNVAIILDATGSMNSNDPYCSQSNTTAEQCAMTGIQTMLQGISPCAGGQVSCFSSTANANFRVSLFSFPNVPVTTVADDYNCAGTPTAQVYTLPAIPASGATTAYKPFAYTGTSGGTTLPAATYQITPHTADPTNIDANGFTSDYLTSIGALNSSSILVKAIGNGSTKGCLKPPSTSGWPDSNYMTYFAGAIYAAQTALQAEQAATTALGIQANNAIIFVSDGQANMPYDGFPQKISTAGAGGDSVTYYASSGNTTKNMMGTANTFGIYPDFHEDCQQAIMAAQYAKSQGTRFYAVAYGSEKNGCVTDDGTVGTAKVVITGTLNVPITSASQVIPCVVMENLASQGANSTSPWYFYTDGSSTANGCTDTTHTSTGLNSIFGAIGATFTNPRLLPNNAT